MSLESKPGTLGKVTIGDHSIVGMGSWKITGGAYAELDDTEFSDEDFQGLRGLRSGGAVSFSGNYKADDTTGQDAIRAAYWLKDDLTTLRFYIDSTSYYSTNDTTAAGGGLPEGCLASSIIQITKEPDISLDMSGLAKIEFEGKVYGAMRLN